MPQALFKSKMQFWFYRLSTICKSLKTLYTLPPEKVKSFLDSYSIYEHDWADEKQMIQEMGSEYYTEVKKKLADYYSVLNHLCAIGQVEKMYIPPAMDLSASIIQNQSLFEKKMSQDLGLRKGQKAVDIGCGRGRVASHMASITDAEVTGLNLDTVQLESARHYVKANGMENQCRFIHADMNDLPLPFADNSIDAVYQIQVFTYSKYLPQLLKEIHRILKPGGKLAFLEWLRLKDFNPSNPHHARLMKGVKPLIGAIGTPSIDEYVELLTQAGFEIRINENASIDGLQAPLIQNADRFYKRMTRLIHFLVRCKVLPLHFRTLFDRLTQDGEAFVEADLLRLVTTSHYFVVQKKG